MTNEQLEEIEKRWDGYLEKNEVERRFLFDRWWDKRDFWDMTKALREAWARCETLRGLADEKAHDAGLYARRMGQAQKALREAREARDAAGHSAAELMKLLMRAEQERDESRAEVERLREVVRQVHAMAGTAVSGTAVWEPLVEIHKLTKGEE